MFRDDRQIAACCKKLLDRVRLGYVFGPDGPTDRGVKLLDAIVKLNGLGRSTSGTSMLYGLSSGEQLMLRIALDFWNSDGKATVAEILRTLDNENTMAVASLLKASCGGSAAIDDWLREDR